MNNPNQTPYTKEGSSRQDQTAKGHEPADNPHDIGAGCRVARLDPAECYNFLAAWRNPSLPTSATKEMLVNVATLSRMRARPIVTSTQGRRQRLQADAKNAHP